MDDSINLEAPTTDNEMRVEDSEVSLTPDLLPSAEGSEEETTKPKKKRRRPKKVTVRNLTRRSLTLVDAEGSGVRINAKDEIEVAKKLVGPDFDTKARAGLISLS